MRLVIIGAALFSIHQYMSHTHSERVKRTIDYIDRFEVGEISRSYTNIVSVLNLSSDFVARSIERDLAADAQEEIFSQVVLAVVLDFKHDKGKGIAIDLDSVIGFIGGLQICVDQSLCDERLSRAFFGATAQRLYENFRPYILWRRQTDPNYGTQFEKFAAHASAT